MKPAQIVAVHGDEAVVRLVEVEELLLLLDERACTVEVVAPGVVLADELARGAARLLLGVVVPDQLVPAVPAHVVEGTDLAVLPLHDDDGRLGDGELLGEVAPRARQLLDPAHVEPGPLEDGLALQLEELLGYGVLVIHRLGPEVEVLRPAAFGWLGPTWHELGPLCVAFVDGGDGSTPLYKMRRTFPVPAADPQRPRYVPRPAR